MSKNSPARQLAQHLLDEVTALIQRVLELESENAHLRRQLADAYDGHAGAASGSVQLAASDEEG